MKSDNNKTEILCELIISIVSITWKSSITYFCIEYARCSISPTLNEIHARKTKYCVTNIEIIRPDLVLKNNKLYLFLENTASIGIISLI